MDIYEDLQASQPANEQEAADRDLILSRLETDPAVFDRSSVAHMACSIWTVDPTFTKTLLVYHNIYDSWSWIGGHADGQADLAAVALRELEEETGVHGARLVPCGPGNVLSCEVLTVDGHVKRGAIRQLAPAPERHIPGGCRPRRACAHPSRRDQRRAVGEAR